MSMKFSEYAKDVIGKVSAGNLLCKKVNNEWMFFIVHPGGPYYVNKWDGYWSIPKGMMEIGEDPEVAAKREFEEETGIKPPFTLVNLGTSTLNTGKIIQAYLAIGDGEFKNSNTFELEWPPKSGTKHKFPEVDRGEWHRYEDAKRMLGINQRCFLETARKLLD